MSNDRVRVVAAATAAMLCAGVASAADTPRVPKTDAVRRVVVSIPDRKLALIENDAILDVFAVAVGAPDSPTPAGTYKIVTRIPNPTYYKPGRIVGPGVANPLGTRWIGLNEKGYGIHGTDQPRSIGFARSHGCIRLRNRDVERLFDQVRPGDIVELHAERTPEIVHLFGTP